MYGSELSPAQSSAHQQARVSRADENEVGSCHAVAPSQKGAQASHRQNPLQAPEPVTSERFPRAARLARGADLIACMNSGRRRHTSHLDLAWLANRAGRPRIGIIVPRFQQTAVARNRLRRRLREIVRRDELARLPQIDLVVRARRSAYGATVAALRAELTDALGAVS